MGCSLCPVRGSHARVGALRVASASTSGYGMRCNRLHIYYIEALCLHLVREKPEKLLPYTREGMMVSMRMRGAVISISVYKGFLSTFSLGRGITVPRFFVYFFKGAEGLPHQQIIYYEKT